MEWVALVTMLFEFLKPILEKCLEERLNKAAGAMPERAMFGSDAAATVALIDEAIAQTRWREVFARIGLRRLKSAMVVNGVLRTAPLTKEEIAEGRGLMGEIGNAA